MSDSYLLSPSLEGVSYLSSGKRIYMQHLVTASERVEIRIADDLLDLSGKLLFERNELIRPESLFRLVKIPAEKILSHLFFIDTKDADIWLLDDFRQLISNDVLLAAIDDIYPFEDLIKSCLSAIQPFSPLQQHLKLLALQLPQTYSRTLYCTLISTLVAREMRLTADDTQNIFLAALGHDIGMLMVNPSILNKKEKLEAEEWVQIQQHLPTSVTLLRGLPEFPADAIQAVSEHHERCDGTGYPAAKVESEISLLGQILGLTDSLAAIYFNRFKSEGRSLRDAAAIIKLNEQAYLHRSCELVYAILKRGELPVKNVVANNNSAEFIQQLNQKNQFLLHWFQLLSDCLLGVGFTHGDRHLHGLQNVIIHLSTSVRGGGLFNGGTQLQIESDSPEDPIELAGKLESVVIMQQELLFHLQRLNRMIFIYLDSPDPKKPDIENKLRQGFDKVLVLLKG
jgi:HD-GYP domain-containing protein (c-di-GMP phosphodiesterase class II)